MQIARSYVERNFFVTAQRTVGVDSYPYRFNFPRSNHSLIAFSSGFDVEHSWHEVNYRGEDRGGRANTAENPAVSYSHRTFLSVRRRCQLILLKCKALPCRCI
jgi:hypothetical protein